MHAWSQIQVLFLLSYNNSLFLPEDQIKDKAKNGEYDSQTSKDRVEAK